MVLLVGCGGNSSTLVGAWTTDAEGMEEENAYFELYSDGTGLIKEDMGSSALEWIAENGKLKLTIDAGLFGKVQYLILIHYLKIHLFCLMMG